MWSVRIVRRAAIVAVVGAGLLGVMWMFSSPVARDSVVNNSQVLGALAGVASLVVAVVVLWRRGSRDGAGPLPADQAQMAITYLANETLRYWRTQAKERQITTPSPVSVRWSWASTDVALPHRRAHAVALHGDR